MSIAAGETLLLLVKHADLIINKTTSEHRVSHVMPMLVRAYDDGDPRIQEEALIKSLFLAKQLDMQLLQFMRKSSDEAKDPLQRHIVYSFRDHPSNWVIKNFLYPNQ
ncbi:hypothetical protein J1N35_002617 [Gossypium stocksii]|uniref:Uncharacterized protein n=1 Tax=Gossypium stocksii TaxID=47602 RepID=A0A9D4ANQ6_9ROSI|nr:hypothetical protein J1N35_002617 [Gossypium stocksii]